MRVKQIMQTHVKDIMPTESVYQAYGKMREFHLEHLPVVNSENELVGMLADRDILKTINERKESGYMPLVEECMSRELVYCREADSLDEAIELMLNSRIHALPIVDERMHCVGIITSSDILRERLSKSTSEALS